MAEPNLVLSLVQGQPHCDALEWLQRELAPFAPSAWDQFKKVVAQCDQVAGILDVLDVLAAELRIQQPLQVAFDFCMVLLSSELLLSDQRCAEATSYICATLVWFILFVLDFAK